MEQLVSPAGPAEPASDRLLALAALHGIQDSYQGHSGSIERVSSSTLRAVLAALDVPASSGAEVEESIRRAQDSAWLRRVPPSIVVRQGEAREFPVHVDHGSAVQVHIDLEQEGGRVLPAQLDRWFDPREVAGRLIGRATFEVPAELPLGYHSLVATSEGVTVAGTIIVVPPRAPLPAEQSWGVTTQLYSIRSRQSWGVGDFADLGDLCHTVARRFGADFVLINPVHAVEPTSPLTPSPYLPTSRRFVSPWYIRVEQIREAAYLDASARAEVEALGVGVNRAVGQASGGDFSRQFVDRDSAWDAKLQALWLVYQVPRVPARQDAFDQFCEDQGAALENFALWSVLYERFDGIDWPDGFDSPTSPAVLELGKHVGKEIGFHKWLQWVAAEQLAAAQRSALDAGMSIGVMQDLAVGVHPHGADVWSQQDIIARGVSVGAPPDMYNQLGQNWSQPPWRPDRLEETAYEAFRGMLHSVFRHAGAVRIDHVIGLFRLWWIPDGAPPSSGAYVRYDHEALIGILCLEAQRAGVVVIGEDLGTFEHWVSDYLADRGLLGTSVLWFERDWDGAIKPPEHYRPAALASVTTHDLPPTAGYLQYAHVTLREQLGLLTVPVERELAQAEAEIAGVERLLASRDLIELPASREDVVVALHALLAQTYSLLHGVALADMVGEDRTQNQPGTDQEYPNWRVPLGDGKGHEVWLEELPDIPLAQRIAAIMREGRG
ncbi:4-alpha-glucanotransferase [Rarobacter faecitabidus]|uniref:4-alpha-glucanotransferase n=1 Tax=Rarobacter faecitabidus TaxID=13243 RepID=A0A542ZWW1_RARFA|nr:4-alpha-glucanotransferase [Rarobacter faecitabidus]TQL64746.1 4-alpha-glucanotransferase [Rarobacter faecitabidus]